MKKLDFFWVFMLVNSFWLSMFTGTDLLNIVKKNTISVQFVTYQIFFPIISQPESYFVAPYGSDTNPGTLLQPWKTIGKASRMAKPGDTIYLRGGVYSEYVHFRTSGNEANPIRFSAYPGENPVIDGGYNGNWGILMYIESNYTYLSGIEVRNSAGQGIYVTGSYDLLDNLYIHHCMTAGIWVGHGQHTTVQNSRIWRTSLINENGASPSDWATGVSAARDGVSYVTIRHNTVWEVWGEGISSFEADHTTIEDNISHDNYAANIYISDTTNAICQRNLVYMNPASYVYGLGPNDGIEMGDEKYTPPSANIEVINNIAYGNNKNLSWWQGSQGGGMNNVLIANNTFVNSMPNTHSNRNVDIGPGTHQNVRIMNNIIVQDDSQPIDGITTNPQIVLSHNLWSKSPQAAILGTQSQVGDPKLSRTGTPYGYPWFELTSGSPAIDDALILPEVLNDFLMNMRETSPDTGAIEYLP